MCKIQMWSDKTFQSFTLFNLISASLYPPPFPLCPLSLPLSLLLFLSLSLPHSLTFTLAIPPSPSIYFTRKPLTSTTEAQFILLVNEN